MNRLEQLTASLREHDQRGVAPYLTAGDDGLENTLAELHALERGGAACVELGIPFSDPIADGPALQAAADRALKAGTTLNSVLQMIKDYRAAGGQLPIALMSYANLLVRNKLGETAMEIADAGANALIVPDIPIEEGAALEQACAAAQLCPIFFAAPTSPQSRVVEAGQRSRGFLYVVGRVGVTGGSTSFDEETQSFLKQTRELSQAPIAVGFGIATAEHVRAATQSADLAIVGTALVRHLHEVGQAGGNRAQAAQQFVEDLVTGLK
ncbi:MAG: tryptophan synthase subunit alpha [Planctomycetes bacterium]|nr:tryptophan synthase subunit alpha [Planctomycetota bacterium]MCP4771205.1 tryptophan synthase subunit alpha [Planctomycetota bacterium]MCP4862068.1 tryptophan synthase subunit alpha [Planctomycetota bacterium]